MRFGIVIRVDGRTIRLQVERVYLSEQIERFDVKARNKTLTIQSNRPLLISKGIKHRKPDYKLIVGDIKSSGALEKIIEAIHSYLRNDERRL